LIKIVEKTRAGIDRHCLIDLAKYAAFLTIIIAGISVGTQRLGYNWQWYRVPRYLYVIENGRCLAGPLLQGLLITFRIAGVSLILAFIFGLVTAVFRLSSSIVARALGRGYVELIRNTPLLVQIFFMYFVLSPILGISPFASAVLALSLFEGSYAAEIMRSGIVSIERGQWEAAYSSGLSAFEVYRHVILPQAFRRVLPPLTSQAISLIKDSSLVSTIAIYDLTMQGQKIVSETFLAFEIWFTVAAIYLVITISLSFVVGMMESRMKLSH